MTWRIVHVGVRMGDSEHDYDVLVRLEGDAIVHWELLSLTHTAHDGHVIRRTVRKHRDWLQYLGRFLAGNRKFLAALEREVELCAD